MTKADLSKRVMRSIAISPRKPVLHRDHTGNAPIVIALPNEPAADVFRRAAEAESDGGFNIIVAYAKQYEVITFNSAQATDDEIVISPEMSMGMVSIKMSRHPNKAISIRFGETTAEMSSAQFAYA